MNGSYKVSVIVPVFNGEEYLKDTLASIVTQTLKEIEIIIVNDGSNDNSTAIIEEFQKIDNRIRLLDLEHAGASFARNEGLKRASGEYLAILDSDDLYDSDMLRVGYERAKNFSSDIVVFQSDQFTNHESKRVPIPWSVKLNLLPGKENFSALEIQKNIFSSMIGWSWDKLYRKDYIINNKFKFQELPVFNDLSFGMTTLVCAKNITVVKEVMCHHRIHSGSTSNTKKREYYYVFDALDLLKENLISHSLWERFRRDYINYVYKMACFVLDKDNQSKMIKTSIKENVPRLCGSDFGETFFYNRNEFKKIEEVIHHSKFNFKFFSFLGS